MSSSIVDALRQLTSDEGIPRELAVKALTRALKEAYKREYQMNENAVVQEDEVTGDVTLYAKKEIVEEVDRPNFEISIAEARQLNPNAEIGDEMLIKQNLDKFSRIAAQQARSVIMQELTEIKKNIVYSEFKNREGELVTGYYRRERNGTIFIDLGRTEGIMPRREQSPRERYQVGDRIKSYLKEVSVSERDRRRINVVLSRACPEFVKKLFELEVPEIYDGIVQIRGIVRRAGYRTKVAVFSNREEVDPVGTCVGVKGVRIQSVIREIEGEKIDILKHSDDIREYIRNAMSPAKAEKVLLLNDEEKKAMVVVADSDSQLSQAIGRNGLNVRLASELTGWHIDIMTTTEYQDSGLVEEAVQRVEQLFSDDTGTAPVREDFNPFGDDDAEDDDLLKLEDLPDFPEELISVLHQNGVYTVEELVDMDQTALLSLDGMTEQHARDILQFLEATVEVVEESSYQEGIAEEIVEEEETEALFCANCGAEVNTDMEECPSCNAKLLFE